jgi:hypothetical protein
MNLERATRNILLSSLQLQNLATIFMNNFAITKEHLKLFAHHIKGHRLQNLGFEESLMDGDCTDEIVEILKSIRPDSLQELRLGSNVSNAFVNPRILVTDIEESSISELRKLVLSFPKAVIQQNKINLIDTWIRFPTVYRNLTLLKQQYSRQIIDAISCDQLIEIIDAWLTPKYAESFLGGDSFDHAFSCQNALKSDSFQRSIAEIWTKKSIRSYKIIRKKSSNNH